MLLLHLLQSGSFEHFLLLLQESVLRNVPWSELVLGYGRRSWRHSLARDAKDGDALELLLQFWQLRKLAEIRLRDGFVF